MVSKLIQNSQVDINLILTPLHRYGMPPKKNKEKKQTHKLTDSNKLEMEHV